MNVSRRTLGLMIGLLALAGLGVASGVRLQSAIAFAQNAAANHARCEQLATEIAALQATPLQASLTEQEARTIALAVQQASQDAEMPAGSVFRLTPVPARRVKDTSYLEQGTRLDLRNTTLAQLVEFLNEVMAQQPGTQVTSLRLSAPRGASLPAGNDTSAVDQWTVEATLTYLIFSPKNQARLPR